MWGAGLVDGVAVRCLFEGVVSFAFFRTGSFFRIVFVGVGFRAELRGGL